MKRQEIVDNIHSHLSYNRELEDVCIHIFCYLIKEDPEELKYITYNNLKEAANADSNVVYDAITYLTGKEISLLSVGYEYIDGDEIHQLSPEEINHIHNKKSFYYDGYPISNWESKIFIYFYASDLLKELK